MDLKNIILCLNSKLYNLMEMKRSVFCQVEIMMGKQMQKGGKK